VLVADHLVVCSDCAGEYRLIRSLETAERETPRSPGRVTWGSLFSTPRRKAAALAAAVLIIAGTSIALWQSLRPAAEEGFRGSTRTALRVNPQDRAILASAPQEFSWSSIEAAEGYTVALYDYQSTPVWESQPTEATTVAIPEPVRARLEPGRPFYWRIISRHGIERRQSELFQFTIRAD
jgi:hypothetical protein